MYIYSTWTGTQEGRTYNCSQREDYIRLEPTKIRCCIWSIALNGAGNRTLRKVIQKYLDSPEMWCWRRKEKISLTDRLRNEKVLHRVKEERSILRTIKRRMANEIGHILRRNCLLKEGKIEGVIQEMDRRGIRCKQLLDDLKETERYWKLKEKTLDRTLWRTRFEWGYGPVLK